jgi:hypothetical protein
MTINSIILTPEEIQQYRDQFIDYPEALDALDLIEEYERKLIPSANLLAMKAGIFISDHLGDKEINILAQLAEKYRPNICANPTKTLLEIFSILTGLLDNTGVVIALSIFIFKEYGLEKFCGDRN